MALSAALLCAPSRQPGTDAGLRVLGLAAEQLRGPVGGSHRRRRRDASMMAVTRRPSLSVLHGLVLLRAHRVASLIDDPLGVEPVQRLLVLLVALQLLVQQLVLLLELLVLLEEQVLVGVELVLLVLDLLHLQPRALLLGGALEQVGRFPFGGCLKE